MLAFACFTYYISSREYRGRMMDEIQEATRMGERNRDTLQLMQNWCGHAKLQKFGGTGLIEQMTGLPIGHHGIVCDFAPGGGFASYDLRGAALDFYDRNCRGCDHRKPLRLPNIVELVGERDRARALQDAETAKAEQAAADAMANRNAQRSEIARTLPAIALTLLNDIGAYDADRSDANFARLTHSARLAPEHFTPTLVAYIAGLADAEPWFRPAALIILDAIGHDDAAIAKLAMHIIAQGWNVAAAAERLLHRMDHVSEDDVAALLDTAIALARPHRDWYAGDDEPPRAPSPALLEALYRHHATPVLKGIEALLLSGRWSDVNAAGRGISALQIIDPAAARPILRTMISVTVRADTLVTDLKRDASRLPDLADALVEAFEDAPDDVDRLLQQFAEGAPSTQRRRIWMSYSEALHVRHDAPPVAAGSKRHAIALKRLVWAPTTEPDEELLSDLLSAFRQSPTGFLAVVRDQLDALCGALLLLADRLETMAQDKGPPDETSFWEGMDRRNRRMAVIYIMTEMVEWASSAAVGDEAAMVMFTGLFDTAPEEHGQLRGLLLDAIKALGKDATGLRLMLPHLYRAIVGASTIERCYAATAVGHLPYRTREHVPDLLFEAFVTLLRDPYVIVHKAAAEALQRSVIPEKYRFEAAEAVYDLVHHYRTQSDEDHFVADCVSLLAGMLDTFPGNRERLRAYLIEVGLDIAPLYLRSEIESLVHSLGSDPDFGKLVVRVLPEMADRYNGCDDALRLLGKLSVETVTRHAMLFRAAAEQILGNDLVLALGIIDLFLRVGLPDEAIATSQALQAQLGDTRRTSGQRSILEAPALAARYEQAVAMGDAAARSAAGAAWRAAEAIAAANEKDWRERRSRSDLPFED